MEKNLNEKMIVTLPIVQDRTPEFNSLPSLDDGTVEAANKNMKKILVKMTNTYKDWHEFLPFALCAYRTFVGISMGVTPYSLVYGMEVVFPAKIEIPSLRILSQTKQLEAEWALARHKQLNMIDEKRMTAMCHGQL